MAQASMGDLLAILAMGMLGTVAAALPVPALAVIFVVAAAAVVAVAWPMAQQHPATAAVLRDGWEPILLSLVISGVTGSFMAAGLDSLDGGIAAVLPVLNGAGTSTDAGPNRPPARSSARRR
jgi:hypothetical protein